MTEMKPLYQHRVHSDALWEDYSPSANAVIHKAIKNAEGDDDDGGKITLPEPAGFEVRFGDQAAPRSSSSLRNTLIQVDLKSGDTEEVRMKPPAVRRRDGNGGGGGGAAEEPALKRIKAEPTNVCDDAGCFFLSGKRGQPADWIATTLP